MNKIIFNIFVKRHKKFIQLQDENKKLAEKVEPLQNENKKLKEHNSRMKLEVYKMAEKVEPLERENEYLSDCLTGKIQC